MGRPTVWVLLGLTLLAVSLHEVQVGAEVGPSESECRPYIEKAIHNLKSNDFVEDDNESTENDVSLDTGTSSEDENVVSEESDGGEVNSNEDTTVDETTNDHTHEETNEDDQSKEEQGSAENEEMTDGVDESFEQADQPIVESNDSNETHEEKSEEETENSKQESEEDHTEESEEHHESEEEHTVNVSGEETEEQEEAISVEETGTDDESKEVEDENKTEEHDDNIASEETTEGDQTDNGSEEHSAEESHEKQDSAETDGSEEKKDDSVEDTTETHDDATEFEAEDDVSNEAQETENESGEVHEAVEKVEASRVGRSLPEEEDDTESTEHKEEDNDSQEEEHTTEEEHDSDESKPEVESVEAHGEESHEEEAHDEKSHEEESHEDKSHEDESHEEKSHEEEETHSEESHEEETHSEESHEDEAHVEKSHEDESHENKSHEEESHEDKSHEDESHEKDAHGEDAKSEEEHSHEKEGSAHEDDASKEEAHADEASTEEAHEDEASTEEAHEEEVVKREVHVDERTNPGEHSEEAIEEEEAHTDDTQKDSKEHEDPHPEEDLLMEYDVPTNLRDRSHIAELLHLDDDSVSKENAIQKSADVILRDLKRIYENAIKPLETLYKYRDLSNRHFGDPEIFSKPLVLFMGPWSGGKSTILNYLTGNEYTPDSLRTGAEPSPAYFNILMHGDEPEVLDGTQLAADWTFSGLQKFGQGLEDRLRGLKLPSKLLEKVNIVEIPGILEVRKQVSRLFPFNDACQWFIDRADIIFLVYDPSKLDVGPETEAILDQLKGREYQTRIILNKGDQVKPEELMRVQGALIWNISPLMSSAQPPVMYTTSLWSNPYEVGAPIRLLQAQERAFLRDLRNAIEKRIENKISSARRFAVRVRNHAKMVDCYLTTYYNHKSLFANRKQISDQIIEHPQNYHIYEGLSTLTNISRYDLPDPEVYRDFFRLNSLYEFKKLSETCTYFRGCPINKLDIAIAYDLPELVGKYKKSVETAFHALENESNKGKS